MTTKHAEEGFVEEAVFKSTELRFKEILGEMGVGGCNSWIQVLFILI